MALKRRETAELIAEELRRLDPDDTYASALRFGVDRLDPSAHGAAAPHAARAPAGRRSRTPRPAVAAPRDGCESSAAKEAAAEAP